MQACAIVVSPEERGLLITIFVSTWVKLGDGGRYRPRVEKNTHAHKVMKAIHPVL